MRENLKAARKAAHITQQELADKLGISLRYYCHLEYGRRIGRACIWRKLEKLFGNTQEVLRKYNDVPR